MEGKQGLLIVLQALDTGGKDGTIRHAMSGLNPQGAQVVGFKVPSKVEAAHHFLWRFKPHIPEPGDIVIFNRSHYEDVLVPLVKGTQPERVIEKRYGEINAFEKDLVKRGVRIVKLMLHISLEEQRERLRARLLDPTKQSNFSANDLSERGYWDSYQAAYDRALTNTSTDVAPWYVLPTNNKWFRNWVSNPHLRGGSDCAS